MTQLDRSGLHSPVLGSYASKQCPRRVHNRFDPTIAADDQRPGAGSQARIDAGLQHEAGVFNALSAAHPNDSVRIDRTLAKAERITATLEAMATSTLVVLGGQLPDDVVGGRTGAPDILLRTTAGTGQPRYVAGEIKNHKTLVDTNGQPATCSYFSDPATTFLNDQYSSSYDRRGDDLLQLAHYARMLAACGYLDDSAGSRGFVIGKQVVAEGNARALLVWHDLNQPMFSAPDSGAAVEAKGSKWSALQKYDHEHEWRLQVARVAAMQGLPDAPEPLAQPVGRPECPSCPWLDTCRGLLDPNDASMAIDSGRLTVEQWLWLRRHGVSTTHQLAGLDLDDAQWLASFQTDNPQPQAVPRLSPNPPPSFELINASDC